jgi:hypothetical protein
MLPNHVSRQLSVRKENEVRLFLNAGIYPAYGRYFNAANGYLKTFTARRKAYLADRFGASHFLKPVLDGEESAFFTNGDDPVLQNMWAAENGLGKGKSPAEILLAQIEEHRTEVFYNLDPMRFGSDFVRRLPGSVRHKLCWRAAPSPGADFSAYDRVLCNFPGIIEGWRGQGWRGEYFLPAHDPAMDRFAVNEDRPIDICFIGGYSRHHQKRAKMLESVAALAGKLEVRFFLDASRLTRLAERPLLRHIPLPALSKVRRPPTIARVSLPPIFGLELYKMLSRSKIVINGAIDMAGRDKGNMRCFEAMGCGALMVSDSGVYPLGMVSGETFLSYENPDEVVSVIQDSLENWTTSRQIAGRGYALMRDSYSKVVQWKAFERLLAAIA